MDDNQQLMNQLSKLSDGSDFPSEEVEERARVRKARASVTEHARQTGDTVGTLLSGLIDDSNAEIEAEKAEKARRTQEAEERAKAKREAEEAKKREEAEKKLQEEKKRLEEKEQRRLQMIADMEKKRRLEAGEVDEEEEARKRQEAEAKAAREAAEKAREAAEEAKLLSSNQELADQIRSIKLQKEAEERAAAEKKRKKELSIKAAIVAAVVLVAALLTVYFVNKKAPDYYKLTEDYGTKSLSMTTNIPTAESVQIALLEVTQTAPKSSSGGHRPSGPAKPTDKYGIGTTVDLSGNKIVK